MKICIRRRCKCGCGKIVKPGNKYINGHYWNGKNLSKKHKLKLSISKMGNTNTKGHKQSEEHILKVFMSKMKCHPDDKYCDIWRDIEYRNNLREDYYYCENVDCKGNYNRLHNHHIDLNKKNCHPKNIMTLCDNCHTALHNKISRRGNKLLASRPKDFLVINRPDHISYINKKTRKKIVIDRIKSDVKRITNS